jgi:ferrous iron transport protein B
MYDWATAISLLLFYVFAMQCMSTLAIVKKETGEWKYVAFQFIYMLVLAYGSSFAAFQLLS